MNTFQNVCSVKPTNNQN